VKTVLASIHPEHIAEINYVPPGENTMAVNLSSNALFITLKPGIAYEPVTGSYVVSDPSSTAERAAPDSTYSAAGLASYRFRLLGVYDESSGDPIEDVEVVENMSGVRMRSSKTGTVCLWYVPDGDSLVRIQKPGYEPRTLLVAISPKDTVPITLTLAKAK
jgi:hypothetical protein